MRILLLLLHWSLETNGIYTQISNGPAILIFINIRMNLPVFHILTGGWADISYYFFIRPQNHFNAQWK